MKLRYKFMAVLAALAVVPLLYAQETITCESRGNRRNYCPADSRGGVTMLRQFSRAECIQGRTWGSDARGIWVESGCRAEFRIERYNGGPWWWNSGHNRPDWREAGACFYRDRDFNGDYFCMRRGENFNRLPRGFNDQISSIRVLRGAEAFIFVDDDFHGDRARISRDVRDLRNWRLPDNRGRSWGDRISSIRVN